MELFIFQSLTHERVKRVKKVMHFLEIVCQMTFDLMDDVTVLAMMREKCTKLLAAHALKMSAKGTI